MLKTMKHLPLLMILFISIFGCKTKPHDESISQKSFCNPLDLSYRFALDEPSRREAADPSVIWFKDRYYLFASKSGGYWHSTDLVTWTFLETNQIPTEEYAPTAIVLGDTVYFLASSTVKSTMYKSADPLSGQWSVAVEALEIPVWDPAFLHDDDGRLYLYWGCSNQNPIYGVEVDFRNNFAFKGTPIDLIHANPEEHGWEVPGDYNTLVNQRPWIEGAWMTKHQGKYYLQYSGPGTEYKSYADGVYVSENPLGPFTLQEHNPIIYKPEGFAAAAGHGSMFADRYGNLWHIGTITISQKHMFERRLGLYPVFLDPDGTLYAITKYSDYPLYIPTRKISSFEDIFPGWMVLSYGKKVEVSSSVDSLPARNMVDEDIRTYWAATSGGKNEYAIIDLDEPADVYAIQINFAEHGTKLFGRQKYVRHRFTIEYSTDGNSWTRLIDKSENETDNSHVYFELSNKVTCRYIKINNIEVPGGNFAISGFRVFGKGFGPKPGEVNSLTANRNTIDRRSVTLTWTKAQHANGYNISYGNHPEKLYHNYMVYSDTALTINSLNVNLPYYFTIEAFNGNGITAGKQVVLIE